MNFLFQPFAVSQNYDLQLLESLETLCIDNLINLYFFFISSGAYWWHDEVQEFPWISLILYKTTYESWNIFFFTQVIVGFLNQKNSMTRIKFYYLRQEPWTNCRRLKQFMIFNLIVSRLLFPSLISFSH